jgi:sugar/nucleoside kinase (ribokinase family)
MGWTLSIARALRPEPATVPERVLTEPSDGIGASLDGAAPVPTIVVVGSASRDLTDQDPRGWRLGGGVSYSALTTARLGLPTAAIVGVDAEAATASELDLLREAGVDVRLVPLDHGPVFVNIERPEGRLQLCGDHSDPIPVAAVPDVWRTAPGWILAPVAAELPPGWADVPPTEAVVAVGWQGLLRELDPGQPVRHVAPRPDPIIRRADLVGLSRDDIDRSYPLADLYGLLRRGASLAVTQGDHGGLIVHGAHGDHAAELELRHYPAIPSRSPVDPTGAGDVFLAALAAARIEPRLVGGRIGQGFDLLMAAAAASLVLEGPGMFGVPLRDAVRQRMVEARQRRSAPAGA